MSENDNIFREVDEDMRREQIAKMWDKYGVFVLVGAILIIVVVGGYNVYNWWAAKRAAENGQAEPHPRRDADGQGEIGRAHV